MREVWLKACVENPSADAAGAKLWGVDAVTGSLLFAGIPSGIMFPQYFL
jgi:hypothetical protein